MKSKAELKAARDAKSAQATLKRLRGEETISKNSHGYIVTSPMGSVSLKLLPVPTHESRAKAGEWGRAQGKPFMIVKASDFFRTSFGKTVQALTHKRFLRREVPDSKPYLLVLTPEVEQARKPSALTNLLSRLKASANDRRIAAKAKADTPIPLKPSDIIARQMRTIGEALDANRKLLADHSYLATALTPPKDTKLHIASDSDFISLYAKLEPKEQRAIDIESRFRWDKRRVNKLVKSGSIHNLLVLFRAGKLPNKCRTYKTILKEINQ